MTTIWRWWHDSSGGGVACQCQSIVWPLPPPWKVDPCRGPIPPRGQQFFPHGRQYHPPSNDQTVPADSVPSPNLPSYFPSYFHPPISSGAITSHSDTVELPVTLFSLNFLHSPRWFLPETVLSILINYEEEKWYWLYLVCLEWSINLTIHLVEKVLLTIYFYSSASIYLDSKDLITMKLSHEQIS